jgi:toxin ParE1/3/4
MLVMWSPRARRAREAAIDYIARDRPNAALRLLDVIPRQVKLLAADPKIGRPGRVAGTRELVISETPFILVYRIDGEAVWILHFLHGARQWPPAPE